MPVRSPLSAIVGGVTSSSRARPVLHIHVYIYSHTTLWTRHSPLPLERDTSLRRLSETASSVAGTYKHNERHNRGCTRVTRTLPCEFDDILFAERHVTHDTLFRRPDQRFRACFTSNMSAWFGYYTRGVSRARRVERRCRGDARCIRELFESCFLQDGHIGGCSSSL